MARFSITLAQLGYFAACARTLNMTAASQELHVAQSAVSSSITQLERALGTSLFIRRHAKGLVLTPAGERLQQETALLFDQLDSMIDAIQADAAALRGTLRVAVFDTLTPTILPQVMSHIAREHPELSLEVFGGDHEQNLADLRTGRAEVAITYEFSAADDIVTAPLGAIRPYIIVADTSRFAKRKRVHLSELVDEPLVLLDLPDSREYFLTLIRNAGGTPQIRYKTPNFEALRSMVASGMGYSILNQQPAFDTTYAGPRAIALEIADEVPSLRLVIAQLRQTRPTARSRAFVEIVQQVLKESNAS